MREITNITNPIKAIESQIPADFDYEAPENEVFARLLVFSDTLMELSQQLESARQEFANLVSMYSMEKFSNQ